MDKKIQLIPKNA